MNIITLRRRRASAALLGAACALLPPPAAAVYVYTYTGPTYTQVLPGNGGPFTTSMRVSGSMTLDDPLPANMPGTVISGLVTAFSFSNGLETIDQDSATNIKSFAVATDGTGAITVYSVLLATHYPTPAAAGDHRFDIRLSSGNVPQQSDSLVWQCLNTFNGQCTGELEVESGRTLGGLGVWVGSAVAGPIPEPSTLALTLLGLVALALRGTASARTTPIAPVETTRASA